MCKLWKRIQEWANNPTSYDGILLKEWNKQFKP